MYCKVCNTDIGSKGFGRHIAVKHNLSTKAYYDLYYKTDIDGYCVVCNTETPFVNLKIGYKNIVVIPVLKKTQIQEQKLDRLILIDIVILMEIEITVKKFV